MSSFPRSSVGVRYSVSSQRPDWDLSDEKVSESVVHDKASELLVSILGHWGEATWLDVRCAQKPRSPRRKLLARIAELEAAAAKK